MISIAAFPKCYLEDITEGKMDVFDWVDMSVQLECEGLELYSGFLKSIEKQYLSRLRNRIESHGMTMPMMCYSSDFTIPDYETRQHEIAKQINIIRVTAELGGQYCRILSGQARPDVSVEQGVDWVVGAIESCLGEAEKCSVKLVIENHFKDGYWQYREFAQKKEVFLSIINRIDSPHFGVQYDPSNALVAGDDPIDILDAVLPRVLTMHASDRYLLPGVSIEEMREEDGTLGYPDSLIHGVTGQGSNDYDAIFTRLTRIGFEGWISIEDGMDGMEEMKASVDYLKEMREKFYKA